MCFPLILSSCFPISPPPITTLNEANQKFVQICKDEYKLNVSTKSYPNTIWIYLPSEDAIIDYKGTADGPKKSNTVSEKMGLNFIDSRFETDTFFVDYDISKDRSYPDSTGLASSYTDAYQTKQNGILTALFRTYSDLEEIPGDRDFVDSKSEIQREKFIKSYMTTDNPPDFIVLVIADIKKGIAIKTIFYFQDFKYYMAGGIPYDEFSKRNISELTGWAAIIDDYKGKHLDYHNVTWEEFIAKQIIQRVRFKYQQSGFKPGEDTEQEIMAIVAETIKAYKFEDFQTVKLLNLVTKTPYKFDRSQIETFTPPLQPSAPESSDVSAQTNQ